MIMMVAPAMARADAPTTSAPETSTKPAAAGAAETPDKAAATPAIPIDQLTLTDDMIAAVGGRSVSGRRVEALVGTGSDATHRGALRVTDKLGALRIEIAGEALASDQLGDQSDAAARVTHETERDALRGNVAWGTQHMGLPRQSFTSDARVISYGGGWTAWRDSGRFEAQALGEHLSLRDEGLALRGVGDAATGFVDHDAAAYAARAGFTSRRLAAFDLDHELAAGVSAANASGVSTTGDVSLDDPNMSALARTRRANSRFLRAYVHDTIRVIESLDISGGFVFEHWRWLASMPPLAHAHEQSMDVDSTQMIQSLLSPRFGALYRLTPGLTLTADASRSLRAPSWTQLTRTVQNGNMLTSPSANLHAETVTGGEVGPVLSRGRVEARAVAYYRDVASPISVVRVDDHRETANLGRAREAGIDAAASVRLARPVLAGVAYTFGATRVVDGGAQSGLAGSSVARDSVAGNELAQKPRHTATATLAYDEPRIVTVAGAVRYIGARYEDDRNTSRLPATAVVDAMAARRLTHGLAGYVAVENVFDRRYTSHVDGVDQLGAPRMFHVGVRLDSARW